MNEQIDFLILIAQRLDSADIQYMLTGSMAMTFFGIPRMTRDIDIVIVYDVKDAPIISALFRSDCYVDEFSIRDAAVRHFMFNIIHQEWIVKADFISRKNVPYRLLEFSRRRTLRIGDQDVKVVSPEDLILSKLIWSCESGSEIQMKDVRAIIDGVNDLDWRYLDGTAETLGVLESLKNARQE